MIENVISIRELQINLRSSQYKNSISLNLLTDLLCFHSNHHVPNVTGQIPGRCLVGGLAVIQSCVQKTGSQDFWLCSLWHH